MGDGDVSETLRKHVIHCVPWRWHGMVITGCSATLRHSQLDASLRGQHLLRQECRAIGYCLITANYVVLDFVTLGHFPTLSKTAWRFYGISAAVFPVLFGLWILS